MYERQLTLCNKSWITQYVCLKQKKFAILCYLINSITESYLIALFYRKICPFWTFNGSYYQIYNYYCLAVHLHIHAEKNFIKLFGLGIWIHNLYLCIFAENSYSTICFSKNVSSLNFLFWPLLIIQLSQFVNATPPLK